MTPTKNADFPAGDPGCRRNLRNRRALELPLSRQKALYAVDDLHRIEANSDFRQQKAALLMISPSFQDSHSEFVFLDFVSCCVFFFWGANSSRNARRQAILGTKQPISGSYQSALLRSQQMLADLRRDPYGVETLQQDLVWLEKLDGRKKMVKAPVSKTPTNGKNPTKRTVLLRVFGGFELKRDIKLDSHVKLCRQSTLAPVNLFQAVIIARHCNSLALRCTSAFCDGQTEAAIAMKT